MGAVVDLRGSTIPRPCEVSDIPWHCQFIFGSVSVHLAVLIPRSSSLITPPRDASLLPAASARSGLPAPTKSCFSASGFLVIHCNSYIHAAARAGLTLQTAYSAGIIYQCAVDSWRRHRCYRYARRRSAQKIITTARTVSTWEKWQKPQRAPSMARTVSTW